MYTFDRAVALAWQLAERYSMEDWWRSIAIRHENGGGFFLSVRHAPGAEIDYMLIGSVVPIKVVFEAQGVGHAL